MPRPSSAAVSVRLPLTVRSRSISSLRPILLILSIWPFNSEDTVPPLEELRPTVPEKGSEDDDRFGFRPAVDVGAGGEYNDEYRDDRYGSDAGARTDWYSLLLLPTLELGAFNEEDRQRSVAGRDCSYVEREVARPSDT